MVVTLYIPNTVVFFCYVVARVGAPHAKIRGKFSFFLDVSPELYISYYLPPTSFRLFKIPLIERQSLVCAAK